MSVLKPVSSSLKEQDISLILSNHRDHQSRYEFMLPNVYIQHDSECDLFCIRPSGLCDEFEIKTSRSDFLADAAKFVSHRELTKEESKSFNWDTRASHPSYKLKSEALVAGNLHINYFWYVVSEGVAELSDIPEYAGFITISPRGRVTVIKKPSRLHGKKLTLDQRYKLARKAMYRYWTVQNTLLKTKKTVAKLQKDLVSKK